jgi:type II secretory pathway pseudopilin PulG
MSDDPYVTPETRTVALESVKRRRVPFLALLIFFGIIAVVGGLVIPNMQRARYAANRTQCRNNLRQIAMALKSYADYYGSLPPAYTVDANGKPLHSWRTLILPYLDQQSLYAKIDLCKAWDDPVNFEAFTTIPYSYLCPSATQSPNYTGYLGIVGKMPAFIRPSPERYLTSRIAKQKH